ncbi:hypothetical protein A4D02_09160 [Niastella koreensis]|uniref:Lipoprotein n=2 Tax=Niastella koreensis TaxID=354356 RepID=G8TKM9_NIAKG|nr:hypothetical protein [Niastella koreensis]AEV98703.1 hypothetical protein Niako_2359 [Niastella koreensis GR20-10]OQP44944.1 hypothetical protein A4D02_09160 [Niastella koreensis]
MNKLTITVSILFIVALGATACKKEGALTATGDETGYMVPQGTHAYDTTILNLYNKYGAYFLYRFTDKDTYWTPTGWKNSVMDTTGMWSTGYLMTTADTNYVDRQLALIKKLWLSYYSDAFLTKFLPAKIMLCASLDSVYTSYLFNPTRYVKTTKSVGAWYNYDNICVNYGSMAINSMTSSDSTRFLAKANLIFMQNIAGRNLSAPTNAFSSIPTYAATFSSQALAYAQGIITIYYNTRSPQLDWNAYIEAMVTRSETSLNKSTANTDMTYQGILNVTKDSAGKIRQRYNLIRNYFITNYGVDLQAIGNAADK